jgi:hypothetical protein
MLRIISEIERKHVTGENHIMRNFVIYNFLDDEIKHAWQS